MVPPYVIVIEKLPGVDGSATTDFVLNAVPVDIDDREVIPSEDSVQKINLTARTENTLKAMGRDTVGVSQRAMREELGSRAYAELTEVLARYRIK